MDFLEALETNILVFSKPEALTDIHLAYFKAGAHGVEINEQK